MHRVWLFLSLLLFITPTTAVQIVEFCPDPYLYGDADEYIILSGSGSLDGVLVSDGEGGFRFPEGSTIESQITIARSGPAFTETHGYTPGYEWYDYSTAVPDVVRGGTFQMANTGDQLQLFDHGTLVQELVWPRDVSSRQGQIHYLENGTWDRRILMLGQSRFLSEEFNSVDGVVFASPDCSFKVYEDIVGSAKREIRANVYEFSSPAMASSLVDACQRGVEVTVLLEGGPVGGISEEEKGAVTELRRAEIPVSLMTPGDKAHPPYRFDHAKYLIIDRSSVLVTSENFKSNGFPEKGLSGNRGWGVVIEDEGIARYFSAVYSHDSAGGWCSPAAFSSGSTEYPVQREYKAEFSPYRFEDAKVIPVLSPDTSYLVSDLIAGSEVTLDIEQAYITNQTDGSFNPFLLDAISAARRGVQVRILLDSYYYNTEGSGDNDEMVQCINRLATEEKLTLEARLANLEANNIEKIHNKGVIADRRKVLVSSINWNDNSPRFNRETGVIIEHQGVGDYFSRVFDDDWVVSEVSGRTTGPDWFKIRLAFLVLVVLGILAYLRKKTRF
jgi:phosphatidylserine/phosphatidylglycerophosphate/cardiolipin synthase-like enzyme